MTCKEYQHWMLPLLDLEAHVKQCSHCMKELQRYRKLDRVMQSLKSLADLHVRLASDPEWNKAVIASYGGTFVPPTVSKRVKQPKYKIIRKPKVGEQGEKPTEQK